MLAEKEQQTKDRKRMREITQEDRITRGF